MKLFDVNVLLLAFRRGTDHHDVARAVLSDAAGGPAPFALSHAVMTGFVRIATNPRAFQDPAPLTDALAFVDALGTRANARIVEPGSQYWAIFAELCIRAQAKGTLVADAGHAALAIEHGCEWVSFDRDFAQFPGLRWTHPLDR